VLRFPNLVQLRNLPADFDVVIEVYALQTWKEKMNHETKYHIRKDNSKMRLTPKKLSKQVSRHTVKDFKEICYLKCFSNLIPV
jgi:actin-binding protein anillin